VYSQDIHHSPFTIKKKILSRFTSIGNIFGQHRWALVLTYTLSGLELLGTLLRPYFLGEAVNDLIKGSYHGLIILSIQHMAWLVIGTVRHMYDTRTYTGIYTDLVTRMLSRKVMQADVSKLSAHSTLAREFVDFLEYDLYYVLAAVMDIFGALILLIFYDKTVVLICLAILVPVMIMSIIYGKKMESLNLGKNDELEKQVEIIGSNDTPKIMEHYHNLRKWQIKISDQEAWNFGAMEILVLIVIACSLIVTTKPTETAILAGDILGIYNYILKFTTGLDTIPYTIQRLSSLQDITRRIALEEEEDEAAEV
jgi:ABC-type multidrug transport system fused ATPase/permease subunit